jgi:uncharacterized protein (DUF1697 family)
VALLRGVNVGGHHKLPSANLRKLVAECGFLNPETYLASGNVIFETGSSSEACDVSTQDGGEETRIVDRLGQALEAHLGSPVAVMVRTAAQLRAALDANPFPQAAPNHAVIVFLSEPPPSDAAATATGASSGEEVALGTRELYVSYPNGQGRSTLHIPAAATGTVRNLRTVTALVAMSENRAQQQHGNTASVGV